MKYSILTVLLCVAVTVNAIDFNIVYFSRPNKQVIIKNDDEFKSIGSVYKKKEQNVFVIHGWTHNYKKDPWLMEFKDMVFNAHDGKVNVFIVDWAQKASIPYPLSARFTRTLGKQFSSFISFLHEKYKIDQNKIHLVGHSLGGQAVGFTGKSLKAYDIVPGRITSLDPAGPNFPTLNSYRRIEKTDAKFVEVMHTNMGRTVATGLGMVKKLGHIDVFLNGGSRQPGCNALIDMNHDTFFPSEKSPDFLSIDSELIKPNLTLDELGIVTSLAGPTDTQWFQNLLCHHCRPVDYYVETAYKSKASEASTCQPVAYQCPNYKDFLAGKCTKCGEKNERCYLYGYYPNYKAKPSKAGRTFFLQTTSKQRFCAHHYGVEIKVEKADSTDAEFELTVEGELGSEVFNIKGDWNNKIFRSLIITGKDLGNLVKASGHFKQGGSMPKGARLSAMKLTYMSNIDEAIRKKFGAVFEGKKTANNNYEFTRKVVQTL